MLGHSMGGYVMLSFVEKYKSTLKAFGFVNSTAFADNKQKKQNRLKGIETMELYGSYAFFKASVPGLFSGQFRSQHPAVVNALIGEGKKFKKENLQQYYYAMMTRSDRTHLLTNSKLPVLFVIGTEDIAAPLNDVLKQTHLPEIAYIHILENTGHMSMLEVPDKLNIIIRSFVNACE
jgi:pimeloyl-ACP methyl ester carboxylesterase